MWQVKIVSAAMPGKATATLYAYDSHGNLRKKSSVGTEREGAGKYRAELAVILAALRKIRFPCCLVLVPEQAAIRNAIQQGWAAGWRRDNWKTKKGNPPREPVLWAQILEELDKHTKVEVEKWQKT